MFPDRFVHRHKEACQGIAAALLIAKVCKAADDQHKKDSSEYMAFEIFHKNSSQRTVYAVGKKICRCCGCVPDKIDLLSGSGGFMRLLCDTGHGASERKSHAPYPVLKIPDRRLRRGRINSQPYLHGQHCKQPAAEGNTDQPCFGVICRRSQPCQRPCRAARCCRRPRFLWKSPPGCSAGPPDCR